MLLHAHATAAAFPVGAAAAVAGCAADEAVYRWASTRMRVRTRVPSQSLVNICTSVQLHLEAQLCTGAFTWVKVGLSAQGSGAQTLRGPLACRQAQLRPRFAPLPAYSDAIL